MTDAQLYLAIGIPSLFFALNLLAIIGAAFWQAKRFDGMSKRFDDMGKWFTAEISRVEGVLSAKLDALAERVKKLEDEFHSPLVKR